MTPDEFIKAIVPGAQSAHRNYGVPASVTIAQAILESSWGRSQLATLGKNLFGIKADKAWKGMRLPLPTMEFIAGKWVKVSAIWRHYPTLFDSISDHGSFLRMNPRYMKCFATKDPLEFTTQMWKAGYATDPTYPDKIMAIIKGRNLTQYDKTSVSAA